MPTLRDLGESGLLQVLAPFFSQAGATLPVSVGDDGAILRITGDLVATMDVLIDEVHFSAQTTPPFAVGWRAACANLSDLAAMGATGVSLLVGLALTAETELTWVEEVYRGLNACCEPWGVGISGGDTCRSRQRCLAVTALGQVTPGRGWLRSRCQVGDVLAVTGAFGSSRAGLEVLLHPERFVEVAPILREAVIKAHQYPEPRLDWVAPLQALAQPIAAMDTSDGLADALVQMANLSKVGMVIELAQIPVTQATHTMAGEQALHWALYGGEDFELLVSLPRSALEQVNLGEKKLYVIGEVIRGSGVHDQQGKVITREQAFAHFA